jgi:CubicO group peptidase (beta-lactamase class C family)
MPWTEFLGRRVFDPCEMVRTHPTNTKVALPDRAIGYQDNDELRVAPDWPALRPSGAFLSTVLDLAKWDAALYTDRVLTASTRALMWTQAKLTDGSNGSYGLGWEIGSFNGRRVVRHGGGMIGFRAVLARYVDDGLTIIVLMNLEDADREAIVDGVAALYLPKGMPAK